MIRIAIAEDEDAFVEVLRNYLDRFEKEEGRSFSVSVFHDGLDLVEDFRADYDIYLLDIKMKFLDGMKTAQRIREHDEDAAIIFITSTVQFAVQGYTVNALGYVLKPVSYAAFAQIMRKAVREADKRQSHFYISVDTDGYTTKIDADEILYVESRLHNICIYTEHGDYETAGPLKKMEALLSPHGFSKCHNAYLVSLSHTVSTSPSEVVLTGGKTLPISRAKRKAFMEDLTNYLGG